MADWLRFFKEKWDIPHISIQAVSGGSINSSFRLESTKGTFFFKHNTATTYPGMFEKEAFGLNSLSAADCIRSPEVLEYGTFGNQAYLLLEWIESGIAQKNYWTTFGQQLALLHQYTDKEFGWEHDNYIGSLHQYNRKKDSLVEFFIQERLNPQLEMARNAGLLDSALEERFNLFSERLPTTLPEEAPALIHGDLWSGNWMTDRAGKPVLIDPATCYGPREMDLAMMQLFGSPPFSFFEAYHEVFPLKKGWQKRMEVYRIYYLLVHVNLFGTGYLNPIRKVLDDYS